MSRRKCHTSRCFNRSNLSVSHFTEFTDSYIKEFVKNGCIYFRLRYPCYSTAELLIYCGADINAINRRRETPLLVYVANYEHQNLKILDLLYENGAYIDQPNRSGLIPIEITFHAPIYDWLRSKQPFNLKSLCARLIQKQMIRIPEQLNRALVDYVRRH